MIIGIGLDICEIKRIESSIKKFGTKFLKQVFTPLEQKKVLTRQLEKSKIQSYARRFAAKEACVKALGTGVMKQGIYWQQIEVVTLASGQPTLKLKGTALKRLKKLIPKQHSPQIHLTMTDDGPYAQAIVIIEAIKN